MPDTNPPSSPTAATVRPLEYGAASKRAILTEKIVDALKTLAWVMPLTLLIWIYAERKQSAIKTNVPFPVEIRLNSKDRIAILREPPDHMLLATLTGPQASLQRVIDTIQALLSGGRAVLQITVNPNAESGEITLDARESLRSNPIFLREGVSIRDVVPAGIKVTVLDMEERLIPIRVTEGPKNLANVRFAPAEITVRAPRNVLKQAADNNRLFALVDLGKLEAINQAGHHEIPAVAVTPAFPADYVTLEPKVVTVTFDVNRPDADVTLDAVPIWATGSISFLSRYVVDTKGVVSIPSVHIVGPQDQIDKIKNGQPVVAQLSVTLEDLRNNADTHRKLVHWDLPEGCKVTGDPEQYTVTFSLIERKAQE